MAPNTANASNNVLFKIFDPSTLAIAIDVPCAPFLASSINDIFSGISPAIGLITTERIIAETPISTDTCTSDSINGSAPKKIPIVPIIKIIPDFINFF
jgi:hypothetical protein